MMAENTRIQDNSRHQSAEEFYAINITGQLKVRCSATDMYILST